MVIVPVNPAFALGNIEPKIVISNTIRKFTPNIPVTSTATLKPRFSFFISVIISTFTLDLGGTVNVTVTDEVFNTLPV